MNVLLNFHPLRSFIWRLGRRLYSWSRRESSCTPETNGEFWLLNQMITTSPTRDVVLLDIGAFRGDWTAGALSFLRRANMDGRIYAFEPTTSTFTFLSKKFEGNEQVYPKQIALSEKSGQKEFFVVGELMGINSLLSAEGATTEHVKTLRVDDFLAEEDIVHVVFAKCDAEGYDLNVMKGAEESLKNGRIDIWQFEYNHRWIGGKFFLKDVFQFIKDKPYVLGKLFLNQIEVYDSWHHEMERFFEANYVLVRKGSLVEQFCTRVHFDKRNVLIPTE